jgi:hypothetical protein
MLVVCLHRTPSCSRQYRLNVTDPRLAPWTDTRNPKRLLVVRIWRRRGGVPRIALRPFMKHYHTILQRLRPTIRKVLPQLRMPDTLVESFAHIRTSVLKTMVVMCIRYARCCCAEELEDGIRSDRVGGFPPALTPCRSSESRAVEAEVDVRAACHVARARLAA